MEESFSTRPLVGRWIALDVRPTRPLTLLGPAWAVICGALASGGLVFRGQAILFLVLTVMLCDALLGAWRALWLESDWRDAFRRGSASAPVWVTIPHEAPLERAGRGFRHLGRRFAHTRDVLWPIVDSEITGLLITGALALCLAMILGTVPFVLTGLVMVFGVVEGRIGTRRGAGLRSIGEIAVPWLIAASAFGHFSWLSLVYALLFTLVYRALLGLATTHQVHWMAWSNLSQTAVALLLIASNTAAGVGIVLLGLLAQILWQTRYHSDHDGQSYARRVQTYVLAAMLIAGLSLML